MNLSDRCRALGEAATLWLEDHTFRSKCAQALAVSTGDSPSRVLRAMDNAFREVTERKLRSFIQTESLSESGWVQSVVLHIGAANVFSCWLHGAVLSLLLGFETHLRLSHREPVFPRLFLESLHSGIASHVKLVSRALDDLSTRYRLVVAYGSDESLSQIQKAVQTDSKWIGYGSKCSVAIAFRESASREWYARHAGAVKADIEAFSLQGCLSPQVIFVESDSRTVWKARLASFNPSPKLVGFRSSEELLQLLKPLRGVLSSVGVAGPLSRVEALRATLEGLGTTRICELGEMQRPHFNWKNGGISLLNELKTILACAES